MGCPKGSKATPWGGRSLVVPCSCLQGVARSKAQCSERAEVLVLGLVVIQLAAVWHWVSEACLRERPKQAFVPSLHAQSMLQPQCIRAWSTNHWVRAHPCSCQSGGSSRIAEVR